MSSIVICTGCGLEFGKYWSFHQHPEDVEKEQNRHNCKLIKQCHLWLSEFEWYFFVDPMCRGERDQKTAQLVDAEDATSEAKAMFRNRVVCYEEAEARACSSVYAAAKAARQARAAQETDAAIRANYADAVAAYHGAMGCSHPAYCRGTPTAPGPDVDVAAVLATVDIVGRVGVLCQYSAASTANAVAHGGTVARAAAVALATVADKQRALFAVMGELHALARRAHVRLPGPDDPRVSGCVAHLKFIEPDHPDYGLYDGRLADGGGDADESGYAAREE